MREILTATALLVYTACNPSAGSGASPSQSTADAAQAIGVYTSDASGFDTHTYYYDTGKEVVVFDAQFTEPLAEQAIAAIRAATDSPIRYLVITHPNPDKFNGVGPFRKAGALVVSSAATAAAIPGVHAYKKHYFVDLMHAFTADSYPPEATVDVTFTGRYWLPLAAGAVELIELAHAAVSSTQTVANIPSEHALIVGDVVSQGVHAWLEGGIVNGAPKPDLDAWKAALDELTAFSDATVYGGRGVPAPVEQVVPDQKSYLDGMADLITAYIEELGPRRSELLQPDISAHANEIALRAGLAYPDRSLTYLINYGVYGLAAELAARQP